MDLDTLEPEQIEAAARKQGWKPEDEWKGEPPPRGFVSAKEFLEAGQNSLPLATKQLHEREDELEEVKTELEKLKSQSARYADMMNKALKAERDKIAQTRRELQKARADAISSADGDAVLEAESKMAQLDREEATLNRPDPGIQEWAQKNDWYKKDTVLRDLADGISLRLQQERPELSEMDHLEELTRRVKEAMPDRFGNPKRREAPPVGGASRTPPSNGRSFEDLPADAKKAYAEFKDMFKSMGKDYSKDEYLANYEWEAE